MTHSEIARLAAACAARLQNAPDPRGEALDGEFHELLNRLREEDAAFAFDREGRPGAIAAVRGALPLQEQELLDAIVEDHACELAAVREAMVRIVRACAGAGGRADT